MPGFLVFAAFVGLAAVPSTAIDRNPPRVPLTIDEYGGVIVDVRVNGAGPFKFMVDTGSARSAVDEGLARELRAPIVAKSEVVTSAGSELRFVARLASVAIGAGSEMRVDGILAPVLPTARLAELGRGVRGLLGQDFLSAFNYTLDYRGGYLTRDAPLSCEGPGVVWMTALEGRFVMAVEAAGPLRLIPDSGADAVVLFSVHTPQTAVRTVADLNGTRRAETTRIPRLHAGGVTMRDVDAFVIERAEPGVDGLMPLHRFASVSFAAGGACLVTRK